MGTKEKIFEKDNDIQIVGNCANCGVEYHIHQQTTSQQQTIERLRNFIQMFIENVDDDMIVLSNADNGEFSETFYKKAEQLLSTTEPMDHD